MYPMEIDDDVHLSKSFTKEGLVTKVDFDRRKSPSRCVSASLGLLCALLLAGNIGQFVFYHNFMHPKSIEIIQAGAAERIMLESRLTNMTEDKDELLEHNKSLKQERDQLQMNMQRNLDNLQNEKNELQTQLSTMTRNRDDLQRSNTALRTEKDQLRRSKDSLQRDRDRLQTNYNSVVNARDVLQAKIDNMDKPCKSGWKKFGSRCFYISTKKRSWDNSKHFCISQGAQLAIIDNKDKQAFINGLLKLGNHVWFGLSDSYLEGSWKWVDGNYIKTTAYWAEGQPNSYEGWNQDCAEFWPNDQYGSWNDETCTTANICICEKSL